MCPSAHNMMLDDGDGKHHRNSLENREKVKPWLLADKVPVPIATVP